MQLSPVPLSGGPGISIRVIVLAIRSSALSAAAVFAVGGTGFAVANLLLARSLPPVEFGLVSLLFGLVNLGAQLAPLGADGAVNRKRITPTLWLLGRTLVTSLLVALLIGGAGWIVYDLAIDLVGISLVGVVTAGLTLVAAASFQSRQSFLVSLSLTQAANLVLLAAAVFVVAVDSPGMALPLTCFVGGYLCSSILGWGALFHFGWVAGEYPSRFGWVEPLSYAGVSAAGLVLSTLERLMIPKVLSLEDLATFGVLAAVVIAPFRMLQLGIGYTLLPRLRAATSLAERRRLVRDEAVVMGLVVMGGAIAVYFLAPLAVDLMLAGKYELHRDLLLAGLLTSMLRAASGFAKGTDTALCTDRELVVLNVLMWVAVVFAIVGGLIGAQWGLVGVIYGTSVGWASRLLLAAAIGGRHLLRG